ncbi:MAG TPA: UDP-N-acetylmuramoyl-tripeptide--D-alanyl-D-alanine ligase [Prolixibacteraceae bacterium]|jgi:UDP-N-acetylmuramoyl-tripeptide--D-alanyl-D-alanine ligase|nr:UDP-N-acetylmuramoyl-tripeptide--D-alanyl-D-alanine ligase [Prolixibacteraceae bacterium]
MEIASIYQRFQQHPVVTTDSRNIPSGSMFFALKGDNFNGNKFAPEALSKGAAFAVVDEPEYATSDQMILVDDVLLCLQQLARYHREQLKLPVLAITGTNGKTTTKELIAAVLSKKFRIQFTQGNLNNHIGVPLTLLSIAPETEIAIIEMGANHGGEIKTLCQIADPDYGIVTNIGKAHLEGFGSYEEIIKTKSELYDHLRAKGGKCFINMDNPLLIQQAEGLEQIGYGRSTNYYMAGEPASNGYHLVVKALFPKGWLYLKSNLIGDYNFENVLAAACVGQYFEVDPLLIQQALEEYTPSNNRSQLIRNGKNILIMDAYNANPTSMMMALSNFAAIKGDRKCVILGDMLELGEAAAAEHQKIADFVESQAFEEVFLVGPQFKNTLTGKDKMKFDNVELLSGYLKTQPLENRFILVKGSRGIHLEKILGLLA